MNFNYFRVVVTLLACFGPFFAYICRLNLSLTIDEMVVKDDVISSNSLIYQTEEVVWPTFQNEEHTLAWMSRSPRRSIIKNEFTLITKPPKKDQRSQLDRSPVSTLSIEFNANPSLNVNRTEGESVESVNATDSDPQREKPTIESTESRPHLLQWSKEDRNDLLGAFFIGYLAFQIPGARAAEMFGAKSLYIITGLGSGLCSLLFPFASKYSPNIVYAYLVRMIMGAAQGAMFPTGYVFICEWLPKSERSQWLTVPTSFSRFGTVLMNSLVPMIILNYNWEMVFYVSGVVTLIWCFIFIIFGSNSPSQSFWLSKNELVYIESHKEPKIGTLSRQPSITASGFELNDPSSVKDKLSALPAVSWFKMATNKAMIVLSLAMFVSEWSNMLLLIKLPGFLGPVLKMDLAEIGFWSSCLIIVFSFHCPFSGFLACKLESLEIEWLDTLRVRKVFEIAAHGLQGTGCLMIAFSSDRFVILLALFIIMIGRATVGGGQSLMPPELSKEYPGTVFAFANTVANTAGVIGPMAVNWLVADPNEHGSWFNLWLASGVLFFSGGIIFCLFADNRPQNYCRKAKPRGPSKALSEAQLTLDKNPEQIIRMDAFSRVAREPDPNVNGGKRRSPVSLGAGVRGKA